MATSDSKLTSLLPTTPYTLAYTLPLLLLSILLIFSGTFLTLDRTRSFPPKQETEYSAVPGLFELKPRKRRFKWYLEGGIGGIAIGYTFGVHLATLLSLLIPARTPSASLSPNAFLAVWILSCLPTTFLAARYRLTALLFAGLEGGALISLGISVILHPSRLPRLILLGVFTCLLTVLVLVSAFIPRLTASLLHPVLRTCTSASGAFGLVVSIALLLTPRVDGWANVWERLWVHNGEEWGSGKEQGLSAAWGIFWIVGIGADWAMRRYFGECPDEKWDEYLQKYVADLPNQKDRAGTFQPLTSFWDRLISAPQKDYDLFNAKKALHDDIIFPSDKDMKGPFNIQPFTAPPPLNRQSSIAKLKRGDAGLGDSDVDDVPTSPTFLKKSRSQKSKSKTPKSTRGRKPIKFGAIDELSSDSDDSDVEAQIKNTKIQRPWIITNQQPSYSSSTPTLVGGGAKGSRSNSEHDHADTDAQIADVDLEKVDYDKELAELKKLRGGDVNDLDYSDREDGDLGMQRIEERGSSSRPGTPTRDSQWSPAFLKRHSASLSPPAPLPGAIPIPATPSLIKAVDRIQKAQMEIYSPLSSQARDGFPAPARVVDDLRLEDGLKVDDADGVELQSRPTRARRWEEFWREVRVKAKDDPGATHGQL
ncbi:hypothetical protein CC2G_013175 [Coprinopsis cinerea AmutBmut pab1-1]|nr:hypothetical protein CC2G_013175 [Coprinopsis cinerea AmutBmut pab1-1]